MKNKILISLIFSVILISSVSAFWPLEKLQLSPGCTDTDGGLVYDIAGSASDGVQSPESFIDSCVQEILVNGVTNGYNGVTDCFSSDTNCYLKEAYCDGTSAKNEFHRCEFGCSKGVCMIGLPVVCTSEGGITPAATGPDVYKPCCSGIKSFNYAPGATGAGSLCYDPSKGVPECRNAGTKSEGWYYPNGGNLLMYYTCSPVQPTQVCTDSDGGINYYVRGDLLIDGKCTNSGQGCRDFCMIYNEDMSAASSTNSCSGELCRLNENSCTSNGQQKIMPYKCPNGCTDGRCNPEIACAMPVCTSGEAYDTGKIDLNGCKVYACSSPATPSMDPAMASCLADPTKYWDQETNSCKAGYSKSAIKSLCSDPDGGINQNQIAHTFGFRAYYADEMDKRIRTGGKDSCLPDNQMVEHYCDSNGFIQTIYITCQDGCVNNECKGAIIPTQPAPEPTTVIVSKSILCLNIGTKSEGWYKNGELINYAQCKDCTALCDGWGTKSEGWYSSCDGQLIKYEICSGANTIIEPIQYKDAVKCIFKDSKQIQKCYSADDKGYTCSGQETCIVPVTEGELGSTITWKSSCGGYAYTKIDNNNDYAEFYCGDQNQIQIDSFRYVKYQCSNGEYMSMGSESSCKSRDVWAQYALDSCKDKCDSEGKCTVLDDINFGEPCGTTTVINPTEEPISVTIPSSPGSIVSCNGCLKDDKCYPIGYRKSGEYCTDSSAFVVQSQEDAKCDNSFECESNVCVSDKCISSSLIQKIIAWFSNLFS